MSVKASASCESVFSLPLDLLLDWMRNRGSQLSLLWSESVGQWECSWLTGNRRYVSLDPSMLKAVKKSVASYLTESTN